MNSNTLTTLVLAASLVGCATAPRQQLVDVNATIRAAEQAGADAVPAAAYHLSLARDQLGDAAPLVDGDNDETEIAREALARAQADATLALSLAEKERSEERADEAWSEVSELEKD